MDISLKPTSEYKEIQDLYKTGLTYEQILAIAQLICAIQNKKFTPIEKQNGELV